MASRGLKWNLFAFDDAIKLINSNSRQQFFFSCKYKYKYRQAAQQIQTAAIVFVHTFPVQSALDLI